TDELRALQEGVDVDESIIEDVPADASPPKALGAVKSWSVHYVELRDPSNPDNPDPVDPFNGFFLIAKDANGAPIFFDTMALTDEGIAHFYFSVQTDKDGNYLEIPLLAAPGDAEGAKRVQETVDWLTAEKTRIGGIIQNEYATDASADDSSGL